VTDRHHCALCAERASRANLTLADDVLIRPECLYERLASESKHQTLAPPPDIPSVDIHHMDSRAQQLVGGRVVDLFTPERRARRRRRV
jgi:hypothetical protein